MKSWDVFCPKNRPHKILTDGGIRLGVVVSDVHGQSARAMVKALIEGQPPHEVLQFASRRLKASREELFDAVQGELTPSHRFVLDESMRHIEEMDARTDQGFARPEWGGFHVNVFMIDFEKDKKRPVTKTYGHCDSSAFVPSFPPDPRCSKSV